MISPFFLLFVRITLGIFSLMYFHVSFNNFYTISLKDAIEILVVIALTVALGAMVVLILLIFPVHEQGIFSHFFVSSVSFDILQFSL